MNAADSPAASRHVGVGVGSPPRCCSADSSIWASRLRKLVGLGLGLPQPLLQAGPRLHPAR